MIRKPGSIGQFTWRLSLGLFGLCSCLVQASDWPQWRGPHRNGLSPETGLLSHILQQGLPELWRQPLGSGFSGLVIADGRLLTLFGEDEAEFLGCFASADGKLILLSERGLLVMAKADPSRIQSLGRMQVFEGTTWTAPALADGKLYLRGRKEMVCLPLHP